MASSTPQAAWASAMRRGMRQVDGGRVDGVGGVCVTVMVPPALLFGGSQYLPGMPPGAGDLDA
jgi:hypothetical protein